MALRIRTKLIGTLILTSITSITATSLPTLIANLFDKETNIKNTGWLESTLIPNDYLLDTTAVIVTLFLAIAFIDINSAFSQEIKSISRRINLLVEILSSLTAVWYLHSAFALLISKWLNGSISENPSDSISINIFLIYIFCFVINFIVSASSRIDHQTEKKNIKDATNRRDWLFNRYRSFSSQTPLGPNE